MKNQRNIKLVRGAILAGAFLQLFLFWNGSVNANPPPPPNCCECQYLTEQLICATKQEYIPYKPIGPVTGGTFNWTPDWAIQLNQVMGASEIGPFVFTSPPDVFRHKS